MEHQRQIYMAKGHLFLSFWRPAMTLKNSNKAKVLPAYRGHTCTLYLWSLTWSALLNLKTEPKSVETLKWPPLALYNWMPRLKMELDEDTPIYTQTQILNVLSKMSLLLHSKDSLYGKKATRPYVEMLIMFLKKDLNGQRFAWL